MRQMSPRIHRREFLGAAALCGVAASAPSQSTPIQVPDVLADIGPGAIMKSFTAEDHRRRLNNIAACEQGIRKCGKKHLITNYIPGQVSYNIGEYPSRKPYDPDEYDEAELDRLHAGGIRLIQIMEDWNDLLRLFGGNKFTAVNPAGLRRFIGMAHKRGMKVILYSSTGYMQEGDPDLRDEWVRGEPGKRPVVRGNHWKLVRCSPASAGWRAYILPHTLQVLDDYGADGLFNDWGYIPLYNNPLPPTKDEVLAFRESQTHDAALEDLVSLIYSEVKRRGGIYKMHADQNNRPMFNAQLYDYLWVGEGVGSLDKTRQDTKYYPPYVVPCFDFRNGKVDKQDEMYLETIPYMQFPLLLAGRPMTGERGFIPGVEYMPENKDGLRREYHEVWDYYRAHPNGPFVYGPWDAFPPNPNARMAHARWLKRYLPLVQEGTWAYIDVGDSDLFRTSLPSDVVATVIASLETYLVLANYGTAEVAIETTQTYLPAYESAGLPGRIWKLKGRSLAILQEKRLG
ncbi:MAG: alpha-amylase family protein [Acidobacteriota bacterium]|nr:alpha-amylase family protein [Acidobacteriota bacterium]